MNSFFRRKSIEMLQREGEERSALRRVHGLWTLTMIGLGGIIGVGIFVLTGIAAATQAGPAVMVSFLIAGLASACAALCYAEFAGLIPVAGSAYTYSYAVLGEFVAWMIGWDLLLEYSLVVSTVSIGWSGYLRSFIGLLGIPFPVSLQGAPGTGSGRVFDLFAAIACLGIAVLLTRGTKSSARFNNVMVVVKMLIIVFIIAIGTFFINPENWVPFMPYGFTGVVGGAALVFFAVFGYDTLTTAAEEAKNPQRDLPRAVILSLAIALVLYAGMSLVLTGIVEYKTLNNPAPTANAFLRIGQPWLAAVVSVAAVAGITSVLFSFTMAASRVWYSMSRDGLLPRWFAKTHPRYKTPYRPTIVIGMITAIIAGLSPINVLAELVNIGTLTAFVLICSSIIVLRYRRPGLERRFRAPLVPYIPLVGIGFSIWLILNLPAVTWMRFIVWMVIGTFVYIVYSRRKSDLARSG